MYNIKYISLDQINLLLSPSQVLPFTNPPLNKSNVFLVCTYQIDIYRRWLNEQMENKR